MVFRNDDRKGAALIHTAFKMDKPTEKLASSREIDNPSPVPPYFRFVLPSACWNASKITACFSSGIPMPSSLTAKAMDASTFRSVPITISTPGRDIIRSTAPFFVNLNAFVSRFLKSAGGVDDPFE